MVVVPVAQLVAAFAAVFLNESPTRFAFFPLAFGFPFLGAFGLRFVSSLLELFVSLAYAVGNFYALNLTSG